MEETVMTEGAGGAPAPEAGARQGRRAEAAPEGDLDERTLADFAGRMSTGDADRLLGVSTGTVAAAVRRGEIRPFRLPDAKQVQVSRRMLARWIRDHCVVAAGEVA